MHIDRFFISDEDTPMTSDLPNWYRPLPSNRKNELQFKEITITYGDYFSAVRTFLERDCFKILVEAAAFLDIKEDIHHRDIGGVSVFLDKHGALYHPSKIEANICGQNCRFVLNVAVSEAGHRYIGSEYQALKRLNREFDYRFIPAVHGEGEVFLENKTRVRMFLGEWFDRYHEFHISLDSHGQKKLRVWDNERGNYFLTKSQTKELYRQAAFILTAYYNIETFEQIYPWHHAAGDFVLKKDHDDLDLKLITVRKYAALGGEETGSIPPEASSILEALVVFFLNLSIRMRLDRVDGVGDIVWSDDCMVEGMVEGFFNALMEKPPLKSIPVPLAECFFYCVSTAYTEETLYDLAMEILNAYPPDAPEVPVIKANLKKHIHHLSFIVKNSLPAHINGQMT